MVKFMSSIQISLLLSLLSLLYYISLLETAQSSQNDQLSIISIMREQFRDQSKLVELYTPLLKSNDYVMTHPNASNLQYAFELPGMKGVEYFSLAEIKDNAPLLESKGVTFISYDIEQYHSPAGDIKDPVISVKTASEIVHQHGMKFMVSPQGKLTKLYGKQFAPYADIYNIQAQHMQQRGCQTKYQEYVEDSVKEIKAANPNITITSQVSTPRGTLDNMKECFSTVADVVDGVTVWYAFKDLDQVKQFYTWFRNNY